ncbi:asparagine synthase (glutamine-hydrolyzing) [bacterium C-53]|nr:asparagine synthase (glutamine-hydrolyzing) [Lachnospiraceae bacterium]NBI02590.1 asparagine synthase (glutamine-hydrolyzing) [Lachnospiraceae bacterium]RKJ11232.1 asparagine synthase (glutamine-hydrolyzing) [bacterium C-53]
MCGIFGCIGKLQRENAYKCINEIAYRGPDALEVRQLEGAIFAHARLSILDTSDAANQPMSDITGRYWIVYNGEVYNFSELKKELEELGYQFKTNSDTEVVLYAYIEWGKDFQYKCNGMWALAIWDTVKKELFLSRDRFGVKPLYYYEQDNNFYFASEMKAFFPIMKERKINYYIFESKNYFSYESSPNCCIKGIKKIQAGYFGYLKNGKLGLSKWWNTLDNLIEVPEKYEKQIESLRELFLDACRIRMRSDVPIGTALSGGVDSSAVAGAMKYISQTDAQDVNKDWQHAFVACMPDTVIDETQYAEIAARYIGLDVQKVMVHASISAEKLLEYMYICEDPYITSPIPFMQTYKNIVDNGVKVTVDGHGADELFGGYNFDIIYAAMEVEKDSESFKEIWKTYNDMSLEESRLSYDKFVNMIESFEQSDTDKFSKETQCLDLLNRKLYKQTHKEVLPTLLRCYDRYSMGNGLEIRMPFMDYRIVSFAFSVSWKSKVNHGYSKKIIRDMAIPFMDKRIMYRKSKVGFNSPLTEWLKGDMKEFILDTVHSKEFYECELLNPIYAKIMVDEFYKCKTNSFSDGQAIWTLLVPFLWKKAMCL